MLPRDKLKDAILKQLGGDESRFQALLDGKLSVVNSCGSGMTAAILWLALQELGVNSAIYDEVCTHNFPHVKRALWLTLYTTVMDRLCYEKGK